MLRRIKQEFKQGKTLLQFGFLKATGQALAMLVPLVVAKFFAPEVFGRYSLAKMIPFFFTTLLITSAKAPFIVYANQEKTKTGKINKSFSVQCVFLVLSLLLFLAVSLVFPDIVMSLAQISKAELFFICLAFVGMALKSFISNLCMALDQRIKDSLVEFVFGASSIIAIIALHMADKITLGTVFLVYFIAGVLVLALFIKTFDFKLLLPFGLDKKYFKDMFNFTKWVMFGATAVYFINWGDLLVLRIFRPIAEIGEYGLGYQIFKGLIILVSILPAYFLPFVSKNIDNPEKMRNYLYNKRPKMLLLGTIVIVLIFATSGYFLRWIYETSYQNSITVLRILLIAVLLVLYNVFYIPILNVLKRYKVSQSINVIQVIINVILNVILIPLLGLYGAAVATAVAYLCKAVFYELYFRLKLKKLLEQRKEIGKNY